MLGSDWLEYFPEQLLTLDAMRTIFRQVRETFTWSWPNKRAEREWRRLAGMVLEALEEAFIWGAVVKGRWVGRIHDRLAALESGKGKASVRTVREVRAAYITFLDRLYGAIFRHVLAHMPTALPTEVGYFHLSQVVVFRYARLRDAEKPALEELLEFLYLGGPRFEMVFSWQPPGGKEGETLLRLR